MFKYIGAFIGYTIKDMLIKMGIFWKYTFEAIVKIANAVYTLITRLIVGIIDII